MEAVALVAAWAAATEVPEALRGPALLAAAAPAANPGVEPWPSRPVGMCDAELLRQRRAMLGDELPLTGRCPACDEAVTVTIDIDALLDVPPALDTETTVEAEGVVATVRAVTPADLAAASTAESPSAAVDVLLSRCVRLVARDGSQVEQLPAELRDPVSQAMAELDPQADVTLDLGCEACGREWTERLDVGSLVWTELSAEARGLLYDVHRIAGAYGWSHRSVLELPRAVRLAYLELVP